ncbi:MAG: biotin--[acetyl-CoA-carboxylase] ligase [Myxococcota bacterium]
MPPLEDVRPPLEDVRPPLEDVRGGLDAALIRRELGRLGAVSARPLEVRDATVSTNDDARVGASAGAPDGAAWVADHQRGGRGRRGRHWHSPPGENVYLSVLFRLALAPRALAPLSLVAGLAVSEVVANHIGSDGVGIKWPNDVLVAGRKVAGILVETTIREGEAVAIVGVGLNVGTTDFGASGARFRRPPTSLALEGRAPPRERVVAELLVALGRHVDDYRRQGWSPAAREALRRRDVLFGTRLRLEDGRTGLAEGFADDGALRLRGPDGRLVEVRSGEVVS